MVILIQEVATGKDATTALTKHWDSLLSACMPPEELEDLSIFMRPQTNEGYDKAPAHTQGVLGCDEGDVSSEHITARLLATPEEERPELYNNLNVANKGREGPEAEEEIGDGQIDSDRTDQGDEGMGGWTSGTDIDVPLDEGGADGDSDRTTNTPNPASRPALATPQKSRDPLPMTVEDVTMWDSPLSSPTPSMEDTDQHPMDVEEVIGSSDLFPRALTRRSTRLMKLHEQELPNFGQANPKYTAIHTKRPGSTLLEGPCKKRRTSRKDSSEETLSDLRRVMSHPPKVCCAELFSSFCTHTLRQRSENPVLMRGYRPDGFSKRDFELRLHTDTVNVIARLAYTLLRLNHV